jgi:hypothetical protein
VDDKLPLDNRQIAEQLERIADVLEGQDANPFRVRAYRVGAQTILGLDRPAHEMVRLEGQAGLRRLPGIGVGLARVIEQLALTGQAGVSEDALTAEDVLATVAGLGPELARRVHEQLGIETLVDLEAAAHDGRLAGVPGLGPKRVRAIRDSLAGRFRRRPRLREAPRPAADEPGVAELLDVDCEYREKSGAGALRRNAPRPFNPGGEAWLPVLRTRRGQRRYTALYSNTEAAHRSGATHDWVVIFQDGDDGERRWTVVTAHTGPLRDRRVVRGREAECEAHYAAAEAHLTQV